MTSDARRDGPGRVTILTFHGVGVPAPGSDPDESEYWISRDLMLWVLDDVADRSDVRVTVDDGFASDVEEVLPALVERGLRASFFPLTGRLGQVGRLDEAGVRELVDAGMEVGVHGHTHKTWPTCSPAELDAELDESRLALHALTGRAVTAAAAPLGAYDRRVVTTLRQMGFSCLYTSDRAVADERRWLRPRFSVRAGDDRTSVAEILEGSPNAVRDRLDRVRTWVKSRR